MRLLDILIALSMKFPRRSLGLVRTVYDPKLTYTRYQHIPWVYAFRFLRVSLSIARSERHAALAHLRETQEVSRQHGDSAVCMAAAVWEGLLHLHLRRADNLSEVQRAIATARAQQLNVPTEYIPQFHALLYLLDLACSLEPYNPSVASNKLKEMHAFFDGPLKAAAWHNDESCLLRLSRRHDQSLLKDTEGTFAQCADGSQGLRFSWLGRTGVYMLGMIFSAAAAFCNNPSKGHRSEVFLMEALKMTKGKRRTSPTKVSFPGSLCISQVGGKTRQEMCRSLTRTRQLRFKRSANQSISSDLQRARIMASQNAVLYQPTTRLRVQPTLRMGSSAICAPSVQ